MMEGSGGQLEDLITLISQSKKLLSKLFEGYFAEGALSQSQAISLLSEDAGRFQALLDKNIISLAEGGIRLNPSWMAFLEGQVFQKKTFSPARLQFQLDQLEKAFDQDSSALEFDGIKLHFQLIFEEWDRFLECENLLEMRSNEKITGDWDRWQNLVWVQLKAFWGLKTNWDNYIIDCWSDAELLTSKIFSTNLGTPVFVQRLARKKQDSRSDFRKEINKFLSEEKALVWEPSLPRTSRISLEYFTSLQGKASAKKIKGRKRIQFIDKDREEDRWDGVFIDTQEELVETLMSEFSGDEKDLKSFLKTHPLTKNLSKDEQLEIYLMCLFRYEGS